MRNSVAAEALADDRVCVHCGTPFDVAGVTSDQLLFCSASCVWASDELRCQTERRLQAGGPEPRRRGLLRPATRARRDDEALVLAMADAGANVRQIWRYTALPRRRIEGIVASGGRPAPSETATQRALQGLTAPQTRPR